MVVFASSCGEQSEAAEHHAAGQVVTDGPELAKARFELRAGAVGIALGKHGVAQVVAQVRVEGLPIGRLDLAPYAERLFEQHSRLLRPVLGRVDLCQQGEAVRQPARRTRTRPPETGPT